MIKVFCGFAAVCVLGLFVLPPSMANLCLDMMAIYLGMAVVAAGLGLLGIWRDHVRDRNRLPAS